MKEYKMSEFINNISFDDFDTKQYLEFRKSSNDKALLSHYLQNISKSEETYGSESKDIIEKYIQFKQLKDQVELYEADIIRGLNNNTASIPFLSPKNASFKFIDLFAGIGGFRLALQESNGKCVFSSEWEKSAQKTYYKNFGEIPFGDISQENTKKYIPEDFDILCAGFPCQAFSIAGLRKGFEDTRGTLFFDIEEIANKYRPKVIFLENVKNFVSHDNGNTFRIIKSILEDKLNYKIFYKVLNSMTHANIPQNRERVFIIAFDPDQIVNYKEFNFPEEITLTKTIHDILEKDKQDDKYYYKKEHKYYPELIKNMTSKDTIYQWRRVYVRENKSNVCPTLTANMGLGGHNVPLIKDDYGIRKLTPRECFSFQGYPKEYILPDLPDSKLYHQAGNSVTMPLIKRIFENILKVL